MKYFISLIIALFLFPDLSSAQKIKDAPFISNLDWSDTLYRNCANHLRLELPKNHSLSATGGVVVADGNEVTLTPESYEFKLTISKKNKVAFEKSFTVLDIPNPTYKLYTEEDEVSYFLDIEKFQTLYLRAIPDLELAKKIPADCRFRIREAVATWTHRGTGRGMIRVGDSVNLEAVADKMISGDVLIVKILKIQRLNFEKKVFDIDLSDNPIYFNVPIVRPLKGDSSYYGQADEIKKKQIINTKPKPKYFCLLIGVEDYDYSGLEDLENPIADLKSLKRVLLEKYAFEKQNIYELENPSRAELINGFEMLADSITERDNLLVFYAGHGFWDEKLELGYWLPSDAKPDSKSNWISNSTVRDYITALKTKHTLLLSDACFSGSIFKVRGDKNIGNIGFERLYKMNSRKAMTSGTLNLVPDKSQFMAYLIKELVENEREYYSARQLFSSIEVAVINNTMNVPQYGTIQNAGDEGGEFIFIKKKAPSLGEN